MDCSICCESFNKSTRKNIQCEICSYVACKECIKKYILSIQNDPHCMNCKKGWTKENLLNKLGKTFVYGEYKKHREQVLYNREIAFLPATQPLVEDIIENEKIQKKIIELRRQHQKKVIELQNQLSISIKKLNSAIHKPIEKRVFIHPCPNKECIGFLSKQYSCGICKTKVCPPCLEIITNKTEHKCDPSNVESATAIKKDTVSCPSCGIRIFKIDGCDQIFCVQCHTAFSWKTGRIDYGKIHNPHYYEWLRKTGPIPDIQEEYVCGENLYEFTTRKIRNGEISVLWQDILRCVIHIQNVELPGMQENLLERNQKLRIDYMLKKISKEQFIIAIQRAEKRAEINNEFRSILETFVRVITDIVFNSNNLTKLPKVDTLLNYTINSIKNAAKLYGVIPPYITRKLEELEVKLT